MQHAVTRLWELQAPAGKGEIATSRSESRQLLASMVAEHGEDKTDWLELRLMLLHTVGLGSVESNPLETIELAEEAQRRMAEWLAATGKPPLHIEQSMPHMAAALANLQRGQHMEALACMRQALEVSDATGGKGAYRPIVLDYTRAVDAGTASGARVSSRGTGIHRRSVRCLQQRVTGACVATG